MKMSSFSVFFLVIFLFIFQFNIQSSDRTSPLIIDHTCENLSDIPLNWIDSTQLKIKWHYAHTSHGGQLTTGLNRIENSDPTYNVARNSNSLPMVPDALCIFDGQETVTYITPDLYWRTSTGMNYTHNVLNNNPSINVSAWSWCRQVDSYSETQVQAYLDSMTVLESEFPDVTFIYMTGNAQATGSSGYNRYLRNEMIRQYCINNNKVLFDFADLDACWYNPATSTWEQNTYVYNTVNVPVEHSEFNGNEAGHTTYESCEQKGRAVWWMMAMLAGWENVTNLDDDKKTIPHQFTLEQNYPNPFNPTTIIRYTLPIFSYVKIELFDMCGRKIQTLMNEYKSAGNYEYNFEANNLSSGTYIYRIQTDNFSSMKKMLLMK